MASQYDFVDSFSDRASAHALKKRWTGTIGFNAVFALTGRFSGQYTHQIGGLTGLVQDNGGSTVRGSSGFTAKFGMGVAVKVSSTTGQWGGASIFSSTAVNATGGGITLSLVFTTDGRIAISLGGSGIIPGTECDIAFPLFLGIFYFVEWEVTFHESAVDGIPHNFDTRVYIEGREVLNVSAIDLGLPTAPGNRFINASKIQFTAGQESGFVTEYCDFYFRTAGIFGAGLRILLNHPESDFLTEWDIPSVGTHFTKVDEALLDTSDFIEATSHPVKDQFDLEDLPASVPSTRELNMVQFEYYVEGSEGGESVFVKHFLTRGGDVEDPDVGVTGLYKTWVHDSDPFDASAYLASEFDGDIAGVIAEVV